MNKEEEKTHGNEIEKMEKVAAEQQQKREETRRESTLQFAIIKFSVCEKEREQRAAKHTHTQNRNE